MDEPVAKEEQAHSGAITQAPSLGRGMTVPASIKKIGPWDDEAEP